MQAEKQPIPGNSPGRPPGSLAQAVDRLFFAHPRYVGRLERTRAGMIYTLGLIILVSYTLYALTIPQWEIDGTIYTLWEAVSQTGLTTASGVLFALLYILTGITLITTAQGYLEFGGFTLVLLWYISGLVFSLHTQDDIRATGLAAAQLLLLAALIGQERGLYLMTPITLGTLWAGFVLRRANERLEDVILMSILLLSSALVIWMFLRFFRQSLSAGVTEAIEERTRASEILQKAALHVAERSSSRKLMQTAAQEMVAGFPYISQARLFLIDDDRVDARLVADSALPELPVEAQIHHGVGGISLVGRATFLGRYVISRAGENFSGQVVFPMRIGETVIGALELHITRLAVLDSELIISALQNLADNLALAVDGVLQYERAEERMRENEALVEQSRGALRDIERLNQRLTGNIWAQYLRHLEEGMGIGVQFDADPADETGQADDAVWTTTLIEAARDNHVVHESMTDAQVIAVPLRVRGKVIGAMEFELDRQRGLSGEDLDLLQEVTERFGMAADNTRLLEESSRVAKREALVNQISARLQSSNSVNATLLEAAHGLRDALKAGRIAIRLGTPPTTTPPPDGSTSARGEQR